MHPTALRLPALVLGMLGLVCLAGVPAHAADVLHMNLKELCDRADRIFRGTVVESTESTVEAGGGQLPVVVYRIRVDEAIKGSFRPAPNGVTFAEVRMLGRVKTRRSGAVVQAPLLRDLPTLRVGHDYLLLVTRPSAIGLSTTVGLGQGAFELIGRPGREQALNGADNQGLFLGMPNAPAAARGPVAYGTLVKQIRSIVAQ